MVMFSHLQPNINALFDYNMPNIYIIVRSLSAEHN